MSQSPRFLAPFEQGLLDVPSGNLLVIRASDALGLSGIADVTVEQSFAPVFNRLESAGLNVIPNRSFLAG